MTAPENRPESGPEDPHSPLPNGWRHEFLNRADFRRSFGALSGHDHFFADTLRGYIRSLQLRFDEAWSFFDRALDKAERTPSNPQNLMRRFLLQVYVFDNALCEAPLSCGAPALPPEESAPEALLEAYPDMRRLLQLRRNSEAILHLHLGNFEAAADTFEDLIQQNGFVKTRSGTTNPSALTMNYIGLAAAQLNLELEDEARRNLENASFALLSGGELINRARAASVLHAFYSFLDERKEAQSWKTYLQRLSCPRETVTAFLRRARIVHQRCVEHSGLVLL